MTLALYTYKKGGHMHKDISIWMPLYIGDLQAKFARMTAEQVGAALLLMMDFWKNGAIPHDLATVCSITKLSQHTTAKTLLNTLIALDLFCCGGWVKLPVWCAGGAMGAAAWYWPGAG